MRNALVWFLALQAGLLLIRLDLLSLWGDELFTLQTVQKPVPQILQSLKADIHPPLYYLLAHWWIELPLPWGTMEKIRALSALWTMTATVLLDRLLLRRLPVSGRMLGLAFWTLSPCALLYGRMGRSYAMQAALTIAAAYSFWKLREDPGPRRALLAAFCGVLLLYTHYVPAIAAIGAFSALFLWDVWRASARRVLLFWCGALLVICAAYLPWALTLTDALRRWSDAAGFSSRYQVTKSAILEHGVKTAFGAVSLLLGESLPPIALVLSLAFAVLLLDCLRRAWRRRDASLFLFAMAACIGYFGVSRWVSYPFIPARLLWLLPFVWAWLAGQAELRSGRRRIAVAGLLLANVLSIVSYFGKQHYLNKGYAAPLREIAATVREQGGGAVYVDTFNTDATSFAHYAGRAYAVHFLSEPASRNQERVWVLRNTHDVSPGRVSSRVEAELCAGRAMTRTGYVPYDGWQRAAMRAIGIEGPPQHFLQLTRCE
ncbi:MAG: glycosyltransferase family 39 protein [Bryobacterales bacterium]|nr:glycosyltransferase family 39 protein [Bryobacterales bacterium]